VCKEWGIDNLVLAVKDGDMPYYNEKDVCATCARVLMAEGKALGLGFGVPRGTAGLAGGNPHVRITCSLCGCFKLAEEKVCPCCKDSEELAEKYRKLWPGFDSAAWEPLREISAGFAKGVNPRELNRHLSFVKKATVYRAKDPCYRQVCGAAGVLASFGVEKYRWVRGQTTVQYVLGGADVKTTQLLSLDGHELFIDDGEHGAAEKELVNLVRTHLRDPLWEQVAAEWDAARTELMDQSDVHTLQFDFAKGVVGEKHFVCRIRNGALRVGRKETLQFQIGGQRGASPVVEEEAARDREAVENSGLQINLEFPLLCLGLDRLINDKSVSTKQLLVFLLTNPPYEYWLHPGYTNVYQELLLTLFLKAERESEAMRQKYRKGGGKGGRQDQRLLRYVGDMLGALRRTRQERASLTHMHMRLGSGHIFATLVCNAQWFLDGNALADPGLVVRVSEARFSVWLEKV